MATNIGDIQGGMEVFDIGGRRLGVVGDVFLSRSDPDTPNVRDTITVPLPPEESSASANIAPTRAPESNFVVEGDGESYLIPFEAVGNVFPGQNLMLDCSREECRERYRR